MVRPIQLYKTAYQLEEEGALHEQLLSGTPFLERLFQTDDLREEIREKARADLTPEERERLEIEKTISDLKSTRGISRRLNHIESIFHEDDERLYTLYQLDPEFMTPIIDAWMKRPARLKKAQERIKRIHQRRGEDQPQEE